MTMQACSNFRISQHKESLSLVIDKINKAKLHLVRLISEVYFLASIINSNYDWSSPLSHISRKICSLLLKSGSSSDSLACLVMSVESVSINSIFSWLAVGVCAKRHLSENLQKPLCRQFRQISLLTGDALQHEIVSPSESFKKGSQGF